MTPELRNIPLADLQPSKTNPRKHFSDDSIEELAASIREQGILEPLLVREHRESSMVFEIIAGERRFRASKAAGLEAVPCYVRTMTDEQVLEAQLVENLQRDGLTALEEAVGYRRLVDYGRSQAEIARRVGKSEKVIVLRLALLNLSPEAQKAIDDGRLPPSTGALIGRIPSEKDRLAAFADIMRGDGFTAGPLPPEAAQALIQNRYVRSLRKPPFDIEAAHLVPDAGPCLTCPHYTAGKAPTCASPSCYHAKAAAAFRNQAEKRAAKIRARIADQDESAAIFPEHSVGGAPDYRTGLVDVNAHPDPHELKAEVERAPSWSSLIAQAEAKTGAQIERLLVSDRRGHMRELVNASDAKALIAKGGETIFEDGAPGRTSRAPDWEKAQRAKEKEASEQRLAENIAALDLLYEAIKKRPMDRELWRGVLLISSDHAGGDGNWLFTKWRQIDSKGEQSKYGVVRRWLCQQSPEEQAWHAPLLLVAANMKNSGIACESVSELAEALQVDLSGISAKVKKQRAEAKAAKKATAKKAAQAPAAQGGSSGRRSITPELKEAVREAVAAGETSSRIAERLKISVPAVQNIKKELGIRIPSAPAAAAKKPKRANGAKLTAALREEIQTRLTAGESLRTIQAATGVSRPTIAKIKKELAQAA